MSKSSSNSNCPEHVFPVGIFEAEILQWKFALELSEHAMPAKKIRTLLKQVKNKLYKILSSPIYIPNAMQNVRA